MKNAKVFTNAKWIIICKIIQSVLQLLVGMLSARYLGPSNYGLINYAASITAFAMPIMISCAVQSVFQFLDTATVQKALSLSTP